MGTLMEVRREVQGLGFRVSEGLGISMNMNLKVGTHQHFTVDACTLRVCWILLYGDRYAPKNTAYLTPDTTPYPKP